MMHKVTVSKDALLIKLRENKKKHRETFAEACVHHSAKMAEYLEDLAEQFGGGEMPKVDLNRYPRPEQFLDEYDRAIEMLEWHTDDEVVLTEPEFRQYVEDEWGWQSRFAATSLRYTES